MPGEDLEVSGPLTLPPEIELRLRRLLLENALEHGGKGRTGPTVSRLLADAPDLRAHAAELQERANAALQEFSGLPVESLRTELDRLGGPERARPKAATAPVEGVFPDLPGAEVGHVILRMAPFPSGALHIGNARMLYVNDHYRQRYGGRLLLVFDDTVGSEEKRIADDVYDVILKDLELAGVRPDEVHYKSDRLPVVYAWALRVIERDGAYVCTCAPDILRDRRAHGEACPERTQTRAETREGWERMLSGSYAPGEAVLRLRTSLADPDPAFRDRVLCRLSDVDHPRVGRRYRVWPMLEFSWAVDDVELGITHVLRGKDLVIEDRMERFLWDLLGLAGPAFVHWGLLRVAEAKLSKSKGSAQVRTGEFDGWADPRLWSIDSLDRRGITAEALRKFTLSFGMSLADIEVPAETLYAENRQVIDATTERRAFVPDPIRVDVAGYPSELSAVDLANHPDRPELGRRSVSAGPGFWLAGADVRAHLGEEVRLKDLANLRLPGELPAAGPAGATFTSRENKRLPRLQWVSARNSVALTLLDPDGSRRSGRAEASLSTARPRDRYQFERVGFVRIEADWVPNTEPVRACFGHP